MPRKVRASSFRLSLQGKSQGMSEHVEITLVGGLPGHACSGSCSRPLPASYQSSPCCGNLQSPRDAGDEGMGSLVSKEVSGVREVTESRADGVSETKGKSCSMLLWTDDYSHRVSSTPSPGQHPPSPPCP